MRPLAARSGALGAVPATAGFPGGAGRPPGAGWIWVNLLSSTLEFILPQNRSKRIRARRARRTRRDADFVRLRRTDKERSGMGKAAGGNAQGHAGYRPDEALRELCGILLRRGLVESAEEYTVPMLEELTHYAYFTGCINRGDVERLLGLNREETRHRIRSWKRWQEGNRSCQIFQNPFYEEWQAEEAEPETRRS